MSMLSQQADDLRNKADELRHVNVDDSSVELLFAVMGAMREAADTIEGLRDRLQASEDVTQTVEWAELQSRLAEAERSAAMYKRIAEDQKQLNRNMRNTVNAVTGADAESRWRKLFGTPERAAQTLIQSSVECHSANSYCDRCPFHGAMTCPGNLDEDDYNALLEWLRGDA